jgi:hypothetical protein
MSKRIALVVGNSTYQDNYFIGKFADLGASAAMAGLLWLLYVGLYLVLD